MYNHNLILANCRKQSLENNSYKKKSFPELYSQQTANCSCPLRKTEIHNGIYTYVTISKKNQVSSSRR